MAKSDNLEVARRVDKCLDWILKGWNPYRIVKYILFNESLEDGHPDKDNDLVWEVSKDMIFRYCKKADKLIEKDIRKPRREAEFRKALTRYLEQYRKANESDDVTGAIKAQEKIDKLTGILNFGGEKKQDASEQAIIKLDDGTEVVF